MEPIKLKKKIMYGVISLCGYVAKTLCHNVGMSICQYVQVSIDVVSSDVKSGDLKMQHPFHQPLSWRYKFLIFANLGPFSTFCQPWTFRFNFPTLVLQLHFASLEPLAKNFQFLTLGTFGQSLTFGYLFPALDFQILFANLEPLGTFCQPSTFRYTLPSLDLYIPFANHESFGTFSNLGHLGVICQLCPLCTIYLP